MCGTWTEELLLTSEGIAPHLPRAPPFGGVRDWMGKSVVPEYQTDTKNIPQCGGVGDKLNAEVVNSPSSSKVTRERHGEVVARTSC